MAIATSNVRVDFSLPGYFYSVSPSDVITANSTEVRLRAPDGDIQSYQGRFSYYGDGSLNWYGSTLNALVEYSGSGAELGRVSGMNIPGSTYYNYALSNNFYGLKSYAFNSHDTMNGSSFSDVLLGFAGNDSVYGNGGNDHIEGGSGNDFVYGGDGIDEMLGGYGDDYLNGGTGIDTAVFQGRWSEYDIRFNYVIDKVSGRDASDFFIDVERLDFSDGMVGLDIGAGQISGEAFRIYQAAFGRAADEGGLGYWISRLDNGADLTTDVAQSFINSAEFQQTYGPSISNNEFVTLLYNNVLDRSPDQGGLNFWRGQMEHGMSRAEVLVNFSESVENVNNTQLAIGNGVNFDLWMG